MALPKEGPRGVAKCRKVLHFHRWSMETNSRSEFCFHAWGANSYGQLGQGHTEDQPQPQRADTTALREAAVRAVSGGGGHSVLLTEDGKVHVCGQNHKGQLGLGHTTDLVTLQLCRTIKQRVTEVACGWDFTLLLTDAGHLLACGSNIFGQLGVGESVKHSADPLLLQSLKEPIVSIAAGLRHSLAVTDSGGVYQWGKGLLSLARKALSPQLVPAHLASSLPCPVPGLEKKTSYSVCAGSAHCVCLTGDGDLFLWGSNKHGQLSRTENFLTSPTLLTRLLFGGEKVRSVWSGWTHLVAQTESGKVFTWGRGSYGQLGRSPPSTQTLLQESHLAAVPPAEVEALYGATQVACGSEHNLAIVGGHLLSWGWNEHGMCGTGSHSIVFEPWQVSVERPLLIGCGAGHSMAVSAARTTEEPHSPSPPQGAKPSDSQVADQSPVEAAL